MDAFSSHIALMQGPQDISQKCDNALEKEVEEQDAASTAQEAVEDERNLTACSPRRCHAETFRQIYCYSVLFLHIKCM